jgi:transposase-like protein
MKIYKNRQELVEQYFKSGMTQKDWCNENNIKQSTLGTWISKENKTNKVVNQKWIEATSALTVQKKSMSKFIEVKIGDFTISLTENFNKDVFVEVAKELQKLC